MVMSRLTRDGTAEPISRDQILRRERGQGNIPILPVQLTTSRIGNLTRLILTLAICDGHTCIHHPEGNRTGYFQLWKKKKETSPKSTNQSPDGEVRGSRGSLVRMRDMDPPEGPLRQAPYNTSQDVASNPRSLVQVAEQAHPLVQTRPSANRMREHRDNRAHEEVVVGGGAVPHG